MVKKGFTIEYWQDRAEAARSIAEQLRDPHARGQMLRVAEGYQNLAERSARTHGERTDRR